MIHHPVNACLLTEKYARLLRTSFINTSLCLLELTLNVFVAIVSEVISWLCLQLAFDIVGEKVATSKGTQCTCHSSAL